MKRFRFRLARLLALRERILERRRAELEAARASIRRIEADLERSRSLRSGALDSVAAAGAHLTSAGRRDLLLYAEHLADRIRRLTSELAAERAREATVLASLHQAARDVKVLLRLRERRTDDYRREIDREEQKSNDEFASRRRAFARPVSGGAGPAGAPGTDFRGGGKSLPVADLMQESK